MVASKWIKTLLFLEEQTVRIAEISGREKCVLKYDSAYLYRYAHTSVKYEVCVLLSLSTILFTLNICNFLRRTDIRRSLW